MDGSQPGRDYWNYEPQSKELIIINIPRFQQKKTFQDATNIQKFTTKFEVNVDGLEIPYGAIIFTRVTQTMCCL